MSLTLDKLLTADLPDDVAPALKEILNRAEATREADGYLSDDELHLATKVIHQYAKRCGITPSPIDLTDMSRAYTRVMTEVLAIYDLYRARRLENEVDAKLEQIFAKKSGEDVAIAVLTSEEKTTIAGKLEFIRQIIESSSLETKKKNLLFKKLNKFAHEVTKDGTDTDTLFAFFGELSLNPGLMAKNAKPALDELKDIMRIVFRNRAEREGIPLPSPEDVLKLPHGIGA